MMDHIGFFSPIPTIKRPEELYIRIWPDTFFIDGQGYKWDAQGLYLGFEAIARGPAAQHGSALHL